MRIIRHYANATIRSSNFDKPLNLPFKLRVETMRLTAAESEDGLDGVQVDVAGGWRCG